VSREERVRESSPRDEYRGLNFAAREKSHRAMPRYFAAAKIIGNSCSSFCKVSVYCGKMTSLFGEC